MSGIATNHQNRKKLSKLFKKLQINSNDDEKEITQQHVDVSLTDDDEVYNNPNLHSKEQDELEIPDDYLNTKARVVNVLQNS
ncbi:unnamed protein product [Rhizophagus irregularis]|nr:unnamed protein product [Rhizophagus irregularis]